ncbi:unnamed protein product [Ectocarpus sp. 12 AP-2014]
MQEDDEEIEVLEVVNPTKKFVPDKMVSVDMGAAWIHGTTKNPITALCEKFSLGLFNTGSPTVMVDHDGR